MYDRLLVVIAGVKPPILIHQNSLSQEVVNNIQLGTDFFKAKVDECTFGELKRPLFDLSAFTAAASGAVITHCRNGLENAGIYLLQVQNHQSNHLCLSTQQRGDTMKRWLPRTTAN
ncbi:hypothetical protein JTE90_001208 [Oedothorax gibbosus]|uniref:Uncharacterized protein n=1 Tax=Oedothorax gibbosus TaxID=931172 RepID=A0AAV6UUJ5_9ARAC|nr:hypothetical protein JTE90_001208 [Oedothorax gibbosus]